MKYKFLALLILSSCRNSNKEPVSDNNTIQKEALNTENEPLSYDELKSEFKDSSSILNERLSRTIFEKIYPEKKIPSVNFDFKKLDLIQLKTAYSKFAAIVYSHIDSSAEYLPVFELGYSALDNRFGELTKDSTPNIKDRLEITSLKSDINTSIAEIKIRKVQK